MSKFFKTGLALVGSVFMVSSMYAQATIEEVIVTAQRTEQSLQDVPIAVSAFTDEMLSERQIEVASDIQLQVPGVAYSANTFGGGGFAIRGIANFATAASADAGVEVHLNGLPLGSTSTNEMGYMDMSRIEVLRGPQGTLFGRNSTGGVVNLITARPDLDAFEGKAKIQYGKNNEKQLDLMVNVPISDELGLRIAFNNFEKDGVNKNLYSKLADQPFDNRDSYMWRATLQWEPTDDMTVTLLHNAFDEESSRTQTDGVWCQTGGNLVQGCVIGGAQVFQPIHPISNGSTVPGLLGQTLGFYVPSNLTNGTADEGRIYAPLAADGTTPLLPQDTGTVPQDFFQSNVWGAPRHDVQESTSQFIIEQDFDNGSLTYAYNDNKRKFYRDTTSFSEEASGVRWSAGVKASALYRPASDPGGEGLPLGYSNSQIASNCVVEEYKSGIFCPNGEGVRGNHILPVSGDAFHQEIKSKTHEIKFVSDLDGMFNFLIGAIDISNNTHSYYDVYASGITLNALSLPGSIGSSTREGMRGAVLCAALNSTAAPCSQAAVTTGNLLLQNPVVVAGAAALTTAIAGAGGSGTVRPFDLANDMISRVDGLYTEHFHNITDAYKLDSSAIFTEFYFDVNERHRLTAGLRYNEDTKGVSVNATFYKVPVISNWNSGAAGAGGIGGDCGFDPTTGRAKSATYTDVPGTGGTIQSTVDNAACFTAGLDSAGARTIGQQVGMFPGGTVAQGTTNGSAPLGALPANNADYDAFGIPTIKEFSETTGRLVWDFQINDDTLFYASYSKGFKGGGFNPPFNAAQFPDTPFTFESTKVDSIEFGVKAAVPEVGLIANASVYYNDFKNFHIGVIRNETAINTGMPLENMGAELELYLTPPSVPGLSFNMMMSYATSEIGTFSMVNPHDLGGHYRKQASTGNMDGYTDWHVSKNFTANSFLINRDAMGTTYARILDVQFAPVFAAAAAGGTVGDGGAGDAAAATANAGLAATNEIYRALHCTAGDGGTIAANSCGTKKALTLSAVNNTFIPFESSAAAVGYGNLGQVCHNFAAVGGVNSCFPAALGGTASVAPTASLIYGGPGGANATNTTSATGMLLPSLVNRATGTSLQTGGACGLFQAMVDHAGDVTNTNQLSLAAGEVCATTVVDGKEVKGKFLSAGLEQNLTGNEMPYPELTMSVGLAYTFQTNNLEVTPRIDYYYQSDAYSSVFNIEAQKIKAWDEINFSLNIVPTDADWNLRFWAQNLTDDRNVTGSGVGNSSVGHTTGVFVREGRSFGMSFGIGF